MTGSKEYHDVELLRRLTTDIMTDEVMGLYEDLCADYDVFTNNKRTFNLETNRAYKDIERAFEEIMIVEKDKKLIESIAFGFDIELDDDSKEVVLMEATEGSCIDIFEIDDKVLSIVEDSFYKMLEKVYEPADVEDRFTPTNIYHMKGNYNKHIDEVLLLRDPVNDLRRIERAEDAAIDRFIEDMHKL